jgi:3-hydroxybutyryl-CoA dehydrogenase
VSGSRDRIAGSRARTARRPGAAPSDDGPALRRVVVLGAGRMGADIALAFARAGWACEAVETAATVRERALARWRAETRRLRDTAARNRLEMRASIEALSPGRVELVVEAVSEDLALKHRLLAEVERRVGARTLIVTNTSGLRIGDVTGVLRRPQRSAGLHFMIPAHVMLAVEVTRAEHTSPATMRRLVGWMQEMGKVPLVLNRDVPGMLINRIQHAMYREIYHLIDSGIASAEDVDRAVRFGFGFRYGILGPVVSRDIHGLPVHLATSRNLYPTLHNGTEPSRTLERLVADGHHGVTTGRGFYEWDPATTEARLVEFTRLLEQALRRVKRVGEPTEF